METKNAQSKLWFIIVIELLVIGAVCLASRLGGVFYYLFYHLGYGIGLSILAPLVYVFYYERKSFSSLGIKPVTWRSVAVAALFIAISIGGQLSGRRPVMPSALAMACATIPLIMTTFFEEFLFRGFFQTRLEARWGPIPAIIGSGLAFSLYHAGYPPFREIHLLLTLLAVGIMFALSFKLARNNLFTSFAVNLPNAVLTYLYTPASFPNFTPGIAIASLITMTLTIVVLAGFGSHRARTVIMKILKT